MRLEQLGATPDAVLIDGNWDFVGVGNTRTLVKGDARCLSIAAASIVAKVTRDRMMRPEAEHFPEWCFDQNKGYPCPRHKRGVAGLRPERHPPPQLGVHGAPGLAGRAALRATRSTAVAVLTGCCSTALFCTLALNGR